MSLIGSSSKLGGMQNSPDNNQYLGGHQFTSDEIEKYSSGYGYLSITNLGQTQSSLKGASGGINSQMWTVSSDMTIQPTWEAGGSPPSIMIGSTKNLLFCCAPERYNVSWFVAHLVFEPADQ